MKIKNDINFKIAEIKMRAAIGLYADSAAKKLEAQAKSNKVWTDRTSNAKNSILGQFKWEGDKATIQLSGNVEYFQYLELAMAKKYAILSPTMESMAPEILSGYKRLVGK